MESPHWGRSQLHEQGRYVEALEVLDKADLAAEEEKAQGARHSQQQCRPYSLPLFARIWMHHLSYCT
jgi:hypothetical protein